MVGQRALALPQIVPVARPDVVWRVVVDAQEVNRGTNRPHVASLDQLRRGKQVGTRGRRVGAVQHRLKEDPIHLGVDRRGGVEHVVARGADRMDVQCDADRCFCRQRTAHRLERETVAEQQVVRGGGGERGVRLSRRVRAHPIPLVG